MTRQLPGLMNRSLRFGVYLAVMSSLLTLPSPGEMGGKALPLPTSYRTSQFKILDSWPETYGAGTNRATVYWHKLKDSKTGREFTITCNASATILTASDLDALYRRIWTRKIHPDLMKRFKAHATERVIVWLATPESTLKAIEQAWLPRDRAETRREGSLGTRSSSTLRAAVAAGERGQASVRRQVAANIFWVNEYFLRNAGISLSKVLDVSRLVPMVEMRLTLQDCLKLEKNAQVNFMFPKYPMKPLIYRVASAIRARSVWNANIRGGGVTIAHIEGTYIRNGQNVGGRIDDRLPSLAGVQTFDPAEPIGSHATQCGAIIRSRDPFWTGIAHECTLLSANHTENNNEADYMAAVEWAVVDRGASVLNSSEGFLDGGNGLQWVDVYFDYLIHYNRIFLAQSAGNSGFNRPILYGMGAMDSPGRAYNVMTVGAISNSVPTNLSRQPWDWSNDYMGYYSSYVNPDTGTEKPEVAAYGNFSPILLESQGTSFAAPIVAGIAGLCVNDWPSLSDEPMALKAKIMASGLAKNIEGAARLSEKDGAGKALATATRAGSYACTLTTASFDADRLFEIPTDVSFRAGVPMRIVLAYSHPPGARNARPDARSYSMCDLDLRFYDSAAHYLSSAYGPHNPFEIIDFTPQVTGVGRIKIRNFGWDRRIGRLRIGVAWTSRDSLGTASDPYPNRANWNGLPCPPDDGYGEENDLMDFAYDINPLEHQWFSNARGRAIQNDDDWYRVTIDPGFLQFSMMARFSGAEGAIHAELFNSDGWMFAFSDFEGDAQSMALRVPAPGDYFLRISGENRGNTYDLTWRKLPTGGDPLLDDDFENNDTQQQAYDLGACQSGRLSRLGGGQPRLCDEDWYAIYVPAGHVPEAGIEITVYGSVPYLFLDEQQNFLPTGEYPQHFFKKSIHRVYVKAGYNYIRVFGQHDGRMYDVSWNP